jgi:hypothetical protein
MEQYLSDVTRELSVVNKTYRPSNILLEAPQRIIINEIMKRFSLFFNIEWSVETISDTKEIPTAIGWGYYDYSFHSPGLGQENVAFTLAIEHKKKEEEEEDEKPLQQEKGEDAEEVVARKKMRMEEESISMFQEIETKETFSNDNLGSLLLKIMMF